MSELKSHSIIESQGLFRVTITGEDSVTVDFSHEAYRRCEYQIITSAGNMTSGDMDLGFGDVCDAAIQIKLEPGIHYTLLGAFETVESRYLDVVTIAPSLNNVLRIDEFAKVTKTVTDMQAYFDSRAWESYFRLLPVIDSLRTEEKSDLLWGMTNLCTCSEPSVKELVDRGLIEMTEKFLESDNESIATNAWWLYRNLLGDSMETFEKLCEFNIPNRIFAIAMTRGPKRRESTLECLLNLMANITREPGEYCDLQNALADTMLGLSGGIRSDLGTALNAINFIAAEDLNENIMFEVWSMLDRYPEYRSTVPLLHKIFSRPWESLHLWKPSDRLISHVCFSKQPLRFSVLYHFLQHWEKTVLPVLYGNCLLTTVQSDDKRQKSFLDLVNLWIVKTNKRARSYYFDNIAQELFQFGSPHSPHSLEAIRQLLLSSPFVLENAVSWYKQLPEGEWRDEVGKVLAEFELFPGDSLPLPVTTKEELDAQLNDIEMQLRQERAYDEAQAAWYSGQHEEAHRIMHHVREETIEKIKNLQKRFEDI